MTAILLNLVPDTILWFGFGDILSYPHGKDGSRSFTKLWKNAAG